MTLADHTLVHTASEYLVLFGLAAAAGGLFAGSFMRRRRDGRDAEQRELLGLAREEAAIQKQRAERLEGELAEQRVRHSDEISAARRELAHLEGVVKTQTAELEAIRQLVLTEPAQLARLITDAVVAALEQREGV